MRIEQFLQRMTSALDVRDEELDQLVRFLPQVTSHETTHVTKAAIHAFKNNAEKMRGGLYVQGQRDENGDESVMFASRVRGDDPTVHATPENMTFMTLSFIAEENWKQPPMRPLDMSALDEAFRFQLRHIQEYVPEFMYAVVGAIHALGEQDYLFVDTKEGSEEESVKEFGIMTMLFTNPAARFASVAVRLDFQVFQLDHMYEHFAEMGEDIGDEREDRITAPPDSGPAPLH